MFKLAVIIWTIIGVAFAGALVTLVVSVPSLAERGLQFIPAMAGLGFVLAVPAAFVIAKMILKQSAPR